jgi:hypothetical protein
MHIRACCNDSSLLSKIDVGTGVAMGNACDEVRAVADEITLDNNSDGIAESLYRHLPEVFTN